MVLFDTFKFQFFLAEKPPFFYCVTAIKKLNFYFIIYKENISI